MANSKISALPLASTPLAGTETVPVVQGGVTEQVSVADLTAGRAVSALSVTAATVGAGSGSALSLQSNATTKATIDTSGNFGVGTTVMSGRLNAESFSNGAASTVAVISNGVGQASTNANTAANLYLSGATNATARGTYISGINVGGSTGGNNHALSFAVSSAGAAPTERMRITSAGDVIVTGVGGLGYGTGSGGTITQATSRTTGVTLNKTNGAITLVSAAGLATFQSFTVTNSTVAATDVVHVTQKSGTDLYQIFVTATAAGSFRITFATTGGITVEQPVFNFAVIKAVTA